MSHVPKNDLHNVDRSSFSPFASSKATGTTSNIISHCSHRALAACTAVLRTWLIESTLRFFSILNCCANHRCQKIKVYAAAASRLVDRAITGGNALLLVTGTPGSGRSHTLLGKGPRQLNSATAAAGAAVVASEGMEQGLLPLALADLAHRWRCGNGNPFFHSSAAAATAAAPASVMSSSSWSSTPAMGTPPVPPSFPLVFRICVAEVLPGGRAGSNDEERKKGASTASVRDLLRGSSTGPRPSSVGGGGGGGGDGGREAGAASSLSPRRWALSARDAIAGLTSSSLASVSPSRSSVGGSGRGSRFEKGGAMRGGRGRGGAAAHGALLTSRVLSGVHEVCAEGVEEALSLIRKVRMRRRFGSQHHQTNF